jgi:hypothetical protein
MKEARVVSAKLAVLSEQRHLRSNDAVLLRFAARIAPTKQHPRRVFACRIEVRRSVANAFFSGEQRLCAKLIGKLPQLKSYR